MGYNTVLFLCNDHLHTIEKKGELGRAIARACTQCCVGRDKREFDVLATACIGGVQPIACEHANMTMVATVGGNTGEYHGCSYSTGIDALVDVLRDHGFTVIPPDTDANGYP